jgi:hypothetical protein
MFNDYDDNEALSFLLIGLTAAALSGAIVGCMIGASIMWLASGGS